MERLAAAVEAWQADPGIPGQLTSRLIDLPGKAAIAERDLKDYEAELLVIKLLRAELRLRAAEGALTPCEQREPATPREPFVAGPHGRQLKPPVMRGLERHRWHRSPGRGEWSWAGFWSECGLSEEPTAGVYARRARRLPSQPRGNAPRRRAVRRRGRRDAAGRSRRRARTRQPGLPRTRRSPGQDGA